MKTSTSTLTVYWIATLMLCADMAYVAFAYFAREPRLMAGFASLGYPAYFPMILGTAKILGIIALLVPGTGRLKEWAYAGFGFTFIGAAWSHLAMGQNQAVVMPVIALAVLIVSYVLRPYARQVESHDAQPMGGLHRPLPTN
ncbi:MAG TPA: DoxX family protein [Candidatus Didemnitutus sp.]|nr:DoxX family protein [Candidatus Didemnitutus sp.]